MFSHICAFLHEMLFSICVWYGTLICGYQNNGGKIMLCTVPKHDCPSSQIPRWPAPTLFWLQQGLSMVTS